MPIRISKPPVNIREKLAELERPIGVNGAALMATSTPQEAFSLIGAGRRNLLINGDFKVSQRGDYSSATSASHSTYYLDRWKTDIYAVTATIQRQTVTLPDGTQTYSAKMAATSTVANSYLQLQQHVEVFPYMQGRTVTMSAWVRSNRRVRLRMESSAESYDSLSVHSGNGGWEYMTQTLTLGTSLSTLKFGVILWNSSGGTTGTATGANITSGDYLEFANYQVEFGKIATPFEQRSVGEELALCQRYYFRLPNGIAGHRAWYGFAYTATTAEGIIYFPVSMRVRPTSLETTGTATDYALINATGSGINCSVVPSFYTSSTSSGTMFGTVATGLVAGNATALYFPNANGYLGFSAEL